MTLLPGRRAERTDGRRGDRSPRRLRALDRVVELGEGRLDDALLAPARELSRRAGERLRLSGAHTVVALAGADRQRQVVAVQRAGRGAGVAAGRAPPTTGVAHAVVWDAAGAGPLLDWLEIPRRHALEPQDDLRGLVLLDLPDHDSTEVAHRLEVDRLVGLVDVLVWVLDPQKYADAAIHDRYLRPLARHGDVMVVVLNQVDRLAPADVPDAVSDVRRLLADDGLPDVPVLAVSATAGTGLDRLRDVLTGAVAAHRAALRRIAADLDTVSATLADVVGGPARDDVDSGAQRALVAALGAAAGIPAVGAAVQRAAVHRAVASTGFPFTRWLRRLRPDPLRRLHLDRARTKAVTAGTDDLVPTSQRTSLPTTGAVERSRVELALRRLADDAAAGLPDPWPDAVRDAARSRAGDLADSLDRAVAATDLGVARKPLWWRGFGLLQALLAATAVAGGLWLAGLYALTVLRLPEPEPPQVGIVPLPTVLLLGGLLAGVLLALLARGLAVIGARRRRARAEARLRESVAEVAENLVLAPVRAELAAYSSLRGAVAALRASEGPAAVGERVRGRGPVPCEVHRHGLVAQPLRQAGEHGTGVVGGPRRQVALRRCRVHLGGGQLVELAVVARVVAHGVFDALDQAALAADDPGLRRIERRRGESGRGQGDRGAAPVVRHPDRVRAQAGEVDARVHVPRREQGRALAADDRRQVRAVALDVDEHLVGAARRVVVGYVPHGQQQGRRAPVDRLRRRWVRHPPVHRLRDAESDRHQQGHPRDRADEHGPSAPAGEPGRRDGGGRQHRRQWPSKRGVEKVTALSQTATPPRQVSFPRNGTPAAPAGGTLTARPGLHPSWPPSS